MNTLPGSRSSPGGTGLTLKAYAVRMLGTLTIAIAVGEGLEFIENCFPASVWAARPGGIPLSSIGFVLTLGVVGALWVHRSGRLHLAVSTLTLAAVVIVVIPLRVLGDTTPLKHRPSYDLAGDASDVRDQPAPRDAHPGDVFTATFVLFNVGRVAWKGRRFCRFDEMNDRDNLRTQQCVPIPATAPGGYAVVQVRVLVPNRTGPLRAEFKQADRKGNWYYSEERSASARLDVTVVTR